jgi:arylsulfatase A-like enzyme
MPARDLQHLIALYDGEIRFTDEHLGRIVARLEHLGALDDTIVVVTSDHGDEFFEHGQKGHSKTLYDEIVRVPLVVRYPARVAYGRRVAAQVRLMDVAPTILGLAGIEPPPGLGVARMPRPYRFVDLTPWVAGRTPPRDIPELPAFSESTVFLGRKWSLRTKAAKLIRNGIKGEGTELYDLVRDPAESTNLHDEPGAGPLRAALGGSFARWGTLWRLQPSRAVQLKPEKQHEARLRALGYIQ